MSQLSAIQQKKITVSRINCKEELDKIINEIKNEYPFAENFRINLNTEVGYMVSEKFLIGLILKNLIENAVKYYDENKENTVIDVYIGINNDHYKILVNDNGQGIQPEIQERIFEMFYRGNERSKGSGLGLYIVKSAVEKLNGTVNVKSEAGSGTAFKVIIPVSELSEGSAQ